MALGTMGAALSMTWLAIRNATRAACLPMPPDA
jgi:hypothetical protein